MSNKYYQYYMEGRVHQLRPRESQNRSDSFVIKYVQVGIKVNLFAHEDPLQVKLILSCHFAVCKYK